MASDKDFEPTPPTATKAARASTADASGMEPAATAIEWRLLAPGVFVTTVEPDTVNVGLVLGAGEALLIDTGSSPAQGAALAASAARVLGPEHLTPVKTVVVTHRHRDHWFGLAGITSAESSIAHHSLGEVREADRLEAGNCGVAEADLLVPTRLFGNVTGVSVGGRWVEVVHLGPGHTDGDVIVVIPDAKIVFAGDLVESAGPPQFGPDCSPRSWASTVDQLVGMTMKGGMRAVPGHGEPMEAADILQQRARIGGIEVECRRLIEAGVRAENALYEGQWPFPAEGLADAVALMYAELGSLGLRPQRNLPIKPVSS